MVILATALPFRTSPLSFTSLRLLIMQVRGFKGKQAEEAVKMVVEKLIAAGKLPKNYGNAARNLLPRDGALLGREHELRCVLSALESERQITIVAGPGEGKTALAAEAAHVLSDIGWLPGGAYAVDLSTAPAAGAHWPLCTTWPQCHTLAYGPCWTRPSGHHWTLAAAFLCCCRC